MYMLMKTMYICSGRAKKKGKQNRIVPLITVTEGIESAGGRRNRTIHPMHFADEEQSSKSLWKMVEGYLEKAYDTDELKGIYVHADSGKWIKNGLETFARAVYVMDDYHFFHNVERGGG